VTPGGFASRFVLWRAIVIRPLSRLGRPIAAALIASAFAASTILPAHAWQVSFNSEGCFTQGDSYPMGSSGYIVTSAVVIGTSTPCGYSYSEGDFYVSGSWVFGIGPYWEAGGVSDHLVPNASHAVGTHSACNPGGPCPNAVYQQSQF
jgi:hypothetical protein